MNLPVTIYEFGGWRLTAETFQDDDRFDRTDWRAIYWTGREVALDMPSLGAGPTEAQFRKLIAMDFPTRVAVGKIGPLLGPDIDMLFEQRKIAA